MDTRPPNTSGIDYLGYYCKWERHGECPAYWADELRPGRGTRCSCPCHEGGPADDGSLNPPPPGNATAFGYGLP